MKAEIAKLSKCYIPPTPCFVDLLVHRILNGMV